MEPLSLFHRSEKRETILPRYSVLHRVALILLEMITSFAAITARYLHGNSCIRGVFPQGSATRIPGTPLYEVKGSFNKNRCLLV